MQNLPQPLRLRRLDSARALPSLLIVWLCVLLAFPAQAQIIRDDTAGQSNLGQIQPDSGVITIDGDNGVRRGSNGEIVVHSFSDYNLGVGETALYTETVNTDFLTSTNSVLTLVRGDASSTLNGAIQSNYQSADMYFVNPNGVFFGPGFTLDVPASFHVSTADNLTWDAGGPLINMSGPENIPPMLVAATPFSWGFLGAGPEKQITVQNFDAIDNGVHSGDSTFSFVGSNLVIGDVSDFGFLSTNGRDLLGIAQGQAGDVIGFADGTFQDFPKLSCSTASHP